MTPWTVIIAVACAVGAGAAGGEARRYGWDGANGGMFAGAVAGLVIAALVLVGAL